jgi:hypothetical protein
MSWTRHQHTPCVRDRDRTNRLLEDLAALRVLDDRADLVRARIWLDDLELALHALLVALAELLLDGLVRLDGLLELLAHERALLPPDLRVAARTLDAHERGDARLERARERGRLVDEVLELGLHALRGRVVRIVQAPAVQVPDPRDVVVELAQRVLDRADLRVERGHVPAAAGARWRVRRGEEVRGRVLDLGHLVRLLRAPILLCERVLAFWLVGRG